MNGQVADGLAAGERRRRQQGKERNEGGAHSTSGRICGPGHETQIETGVLTNRAATGPAEAATGPACRTLR